MNFRAKGIVIAVASAAAGGLVPTAVEAYQSGLLLTAAGLGTIIFLNTMIAIVHIVTTDETRAATNAGIPVENSGVRTEAKRPQAVRSVQNDAS